MPSNDDSKILPPMMNDSGRPQANRTMLGLLLAVLCVAVLLALWFLIFDNGDSTASGTGGPNAGPTPFTIAQPTPTPEGVQAAATAVQETPTTAPIATATPVPEGFEACTAENSPNTNSNYIVDTNTTPLNQRAEPRVAAERAGEFAPGQTGLVFTGECVVNTDDGFTWWQIFNGTSDVWIASRFVTPT